MSLEEQLAHCKIPTGTQSMCFNPGSQRQNSSTIMNYTNRKVSAIEIRTDTVRLAHISTTGTVQNTQGASGLDWTNIFTTTPLTGIYPTVSTFNPTVSTNWDTSIVNVPKYNGDSQICSIYGHVVLKLADGVQTACDLQLAVFIGGVMVGETAVPGISYLQAFALPDRVHGTDKATSTLTVNIVAPIMLGDTVELKIRNNTAGTISCNFYQVNLFCRPIELTGTDKNINPV